MEKKQMSAGKWTIFTLSFFLLALLLFGAIMYITDPLLYFRKESKPLTYYEYNQLYSAPGVIRHYDFDTVIVGSSMVEAFDTEEFDALYGGQTIKLTCNEATAHNDKVLLDVCYEAQPDIKRVFIPIDSFTCIYRADQYNFPIPEYMYSTSLNNSLQYLLNLNIFYHILVPDVVGTMQGKTQQAMQIKPPKDTYNSAFAKDYILTTDQECEKFDTSAYLTNTGANLRDNILPIIEQHPETEFIFFLPCYSMLYWNRRLGTEDAEASLESVRMTVKALLPYDNVEIFGFFWDESITTDLDNYRDSGHFSPEVHSLLMNRMYQGEGRITQENCDLLFDAFIDRVNQYDYHALLRSYQD